MKPAERQARSSLFRQTPAAVVLACVAALAGCRARMPEVQPRSAEAPEVAPAEQPRNVHFKDFGGYLEFVARRREQQQTSKVGALDTRTRENIFEENVNLETEGYVYHPNFLEFTLAGLFGLTQRDYFEDLSGRTRSFSESGNILDFDATGWFLKKKPYPGFVYARRHHALQPRLFRSSMETTTTSYGVLWQYVSEKTPVRMQLDYVDVFLHPLGGEEADSRQKNLTFQLEATCNFSDYHSLTANYTRDSVRDEPFGLRYDSDDLSLSHYIAFGDRHQYQLESEVSVFNQRGDFGIKRAEWRETLRIDHTENLRSWYELDVMDRNQGSITGLAPIDERALRLTGTVEHQLYESLVTQASAYLHRQQFRTGPDVDRYGGQLSFDYRKTNRWGVLLAGYRAGIERQKRTGGDRSVEILDEQHTFRDPDPVTLSGAHVDTGSIFITAEDRATVFYRGRDYTVRTVGDRVEVSRLPSGRIADGQTVLIDYTYRIVGNLTLDTTTQNFRLRQDFSFGLSPYYRLRRQDQTVTPADTAGAIAEDITAHTLGVEYRRGALRLGAEYEDRDSTIRPQKAWRLRASYNHNFEFGASGSLAARWSDVSYSESGRPGSATPARQVRLFTIEGRYRHPLTRRLTVEGSLLYRKGEDSYSGPDDGVDFDIALEWLIRQTEVRISYEFSQFEDDFARNESSTFYLQIRRKF